MGWNKETNTGTTLSPNGEKTVTFKEKSDGSELIVSEGEKLDHSHGGHAHVWGQNSSNPGHDDRGTGIFDKK